MATDAPTEPTNTAAPSPFEACPHCGSATIMQLVADWQDGRHITIVGCGNPWHYVLPNGSRMSDPKRDDPGHPYGITDARVWASEFVRHFPTGTVDEGTLIGWFANAIMTGFDNASHRSNHFAGHRYEGPHDCFVCNCGALGREVDLQRERLVEADGMIRERDARIRDLDAQLADYADAGPLVSLDTTISEYVDKGVFVPAMEGYIVTVTMAPYKEDEHHDGS